MTLIWHLPYIMISLPPQGLTGLALCTVPCTYQMLNKLLFVCCLHCSAQNESLNQKQCILWHSHGVGATGSEWQRSKPSPGSQTDSASNCSYTLALWSWTGCSASLSLSFLLRKKGDERLTLSIKRGNPFHSVWHRGSALQMIGLEHVILVTIAGLGWCRIRRFLCYMMRNRQVPLPSDPMWPGHRSHRFGNWQWPMWKHSVCQLRWTRCMTIFITFVQCLFYSKFLLHVRCIKCLCESLTSFQNPYEVEILSLSYRW